MFGISLHRRLLLIAGLTLQSLSSIGCATDSDRRAELPDEVREDKERIAQGLAPEHHRTKRHVRAAEEDWHRSQVLSDLPAYDPARQTEQLYDAYEADRAERAGR